MARKFRCDIRRHNFLQCRGQKPCMRIWNQCYFLLCNVNVMREWKKMIIDNLSSDFFPTLLTSSSTWSRTSLVVSSRSSSAFCWCFCRTRNWLMNNIRMMESGKIRRSTSLGIFRLISVEGDAKVMISERIYIFRCIIHCFDLETYCTISKWHSSGLCCLGWLEHFGEFAL